MIIEKSSPTQCVFNFPIDPQRHTISSRAMAHYVNSHASLALNYIQILIPAPPPKISSATSDSGYFKKLVQWTCAFNKKSRNSLQIPSWPEQEV